MSRTLSDAVRDPGKALRVAGSLARGWLYKVWYRIRRRRFRAGRNFRVEGSLKVRGPGQVIFGDDVTVAMWVTPWTYSPQAIIRVGNRSFLNGVRMGCMEEISIGADCLVAECHIMDSGFHSVGKRRRSPEAQPKVGPVRIGDNVWIGAQAGILPGTTIGDNSVVGFGAVCSGTYASDVIIAGNPARPVRDVPDTL